MAKAVLTAKLSPAYDDIPERQYHFYGRDYLRQIESAVGDFVVYYEPRRTTTEANSRGGRQAYYATARITGLRPDTRNDGYFYADIGDYIDFDQPVPFRVGENYLEGALQRDDGKTSKGAFGRSVRLLPEHEFDAIVRSGFSDFSTPPQWAEPAELTGFFEEQTPFERPVVEQVIARLIRSHLLDRRRVEFPAFFTASGWLRRRSSATRSEACCQSPHAGEPRCSI
jgi:putative restriction endonuclease